MMKLPFPACVLALCAMLSVSVQSAIVGHTFTGKTWFYGVSGFEDEFPIGSDWTIRVEWDDTAEADYLDDRQGGYPLTLFRLTIRGKSGDWSTESLPGKAKFSLSRFEGFPDEIQFTSGWGPENHTNGTIAGGRTYSINLILGDPTASALTSLSPIPGRIDPAVWSADSSKSYLKFYLTEDAKAVYGQIDGLGVTAEPPAPEISLEQPKGKVLKDGRSVIRFAGAKAGTQGETRTFVIQNKGLAPLTGLALAKTGRQKKDFLVGPLSRRTLAPGGRATFKVTFKPDASGVRRCRLMVSSNDEDENPFDIGLTGEGR